MHHGQSILGGGDLATGRLLPRVVGDHQQHSVEAELVAGRRGHCEVPPMGRIEGAAEHPETLRHARILGVTPVGELPETAWVLEFTANSRASIGLCVKFATFLLTSCVTIL
jgi:hypothetical protein